MYLSLLKLNPLSRKAMVESRRPYELHRSLMRAFQKQKDGSCGRVLFRLDIDRKSGAMSVLVQSECEPDWTALDSSGNFLAEPPKYKTFDTAITSGIVLYFRLRANPTVKRERKRLGILKEEDEIAWLHRKGKENGFEVISVTVIPEGMTHDKMTDDAGSPQNLSLVSVRFEGLLRVTDKNSFQQGLRRGIGSGKGLGFGLLSVAPPKEI